MRQLFLLLHLSKPLNSILVAMAYILGAGIASYLGVSLDIASFWLGLAGIVLAQFCLSLLSEALRSIEQPSESGQNKSERVQLRSSALLLSMGALGVIAIIAILLGPQVISPTVAILIGISLLIILSYAVPPIRLVEAGYGEFLLAVHISIIAPALGFALQHGDYHRIVAMVSIPLTLLALTYFLVLDFPTFAIDEKYDRTTFLRKIGWEWAVPLHHGLIIGAYGLFSVVLIFGLSWNLIWPAYLSMPFALLQVFWLQNISRGAKPVWNLLTINALAVFGLTLYLLTFVFWLR